MAAECKFVMLPNGRYKVSVFLRMEDGSLCGHRYFETSMPLDESAALAWKLLAEMCSDA